MTEAIAFQLTPLHQRVADIGRRERVLVLIGCGLVGLHLVDDNFLQPQPGTAAVTISSAASCRSLSWPGRPSPSVASAPERALHSHSSLATSASS